MPHHHDHGGEGHTHTYRLYRRSDIREIDRLAAEQYGMPTLLLMENAGRSVADVAMPILAEATERPSALVLAGTGNNGGDGLVAARHLANLGARVGVLLSGPESGITGDPLTHLTILKRMGVPIKTFDPAKPRAALASMPAYLSKPTLILDALLGVGFQGEVREPIRSLINLCNELGDQGTMILAVDLPSGLDADSGEAADPCVEADLTVCLAGLKIGAMTEHGRPWCGELVVGDIGAPEDLLERFGEVVEFECDHDHAHDHPHESPHPDDQPGDEEEEMDEPRS